MQDEQWPTKVVDLRLEMLPAHIVEKLPPYREVASGEFHISLTFAFDDGDMGAKLAITCSVSAGAAIVTTARTSARSAATASTAAPPSE